MRTTARICMTALALSTASMGALSGCSSGSGASAASKQASEDSRLRVESRASLSQLTSTNAAAAALLKDAKGVLVFPKVIKGGLIIGGFHGQGSLVKNGEATDLFDSTGGSFGLQAGVQSLSYAMFFMTDEDLKYLNSSDGWEVGVGPNVTVVDEGLATSLTTTTARKGVYCFFFDQRGLMAGLGIQGSKITRLNR